mmetsp:Transcript_32027/g.32656  ORF Transcript_32027/g.32656 Transcript_32027/m.32656 type:complete len:194 (+) Transcript_32027:470-1051(+)
MEAYFDELPSLDFGEDELGLDICIEDSNKLLSIGESNSNQEDFDSSSMVFCADDIDVPSEVFASTDSNIAPKKELLPALGEDAIMDLKGSTAMASRKMSPEERALVLHKRRLRNRQSAKRSRTRRLKTIGELSDEMEEISKNANSLRRKCEQVVEQNTLLKDENARLHETLELYRNALAQKKSDAGFHIAHAA